MSRSRIAEETQRAAHAHATLLREHELPQIQSAFFSDHKPLMMDNDTVADLMICRVGSACACVASWEKHVRDYAEAVMFETQ